MLKVSLQGQNIKKDNIFIFPVLVDTSVAEKFRAERLRVGNHVAQVAPTSKTQGSPGVPVKGRIAGPLPSTWLHECGDATPTRTLPPMPSKGSGS